MSLKLASVELTDFRNYGSASLEVDPDLTVLVGPNGVGKTNLIEAVQLLVSAESFRRPAWSELVRWGAEEARLAAALADGPRIVDVEATITKEGRRTTRINGSPVRRKRDMRDVMPCVVFTPDDLQMIKGSAEGRRAAIDGIGDRLSGTYESLRQEYERTLRQRNRGLRDGAAESVVSVLTEAIATTGAKLVGHRMRLLDRIAAAAVQAYSEIAGGQELEVGYRASWADHPGELLLQSEGAVARAIAETLESRAAEERARGVTAAGPHRDDVLFTIDGRDARAFGSQGQQRTAALAWKLAEVSVAEAITGTTPVLLLDDVMSELDEKRRHALTALVGSRVQTIATTTNLDYFEAAMLDRASVIGLGS